ncbi:carotenoid oxygenase family protein [Actinocorallia lasiicapitis]
MFGAFEPLLTEHDYPVREITGTVPAELRGTLYRVGPGKWQVGTTPIDCLFDGDGMVSRFTIADGAITFRNRYVDTPNSRATTMKRPGVGSAVPGQRFPLPPANTANTNLSFHAGDLHALWEGGRPYRLDPDTLDTFGEHDFDGRLKGVGAWSAHPRWCPETGELFNFGTRFLPTPGINCYKVSPSGALTRLASLRIPRIGWNHDFALTSRHLVFVLSPMLPRLGKIMRGGTFLDALEYRPDLPTRFVLVPREGGRPRIIEHDALICTHITNAYADGDDTVIELIEYPDFDRLIRDVQHFRTTFHEPRPNRLVRYRITGSKVVAEELTSIPCELPQYDWRRSTREHRYSYLSAGDSGLYDQLVKLDHRTGRVLAPRLADLVGEPIFVPRTPDAAEDDGWLLAVGYDAASHRSRLLILDARDLETLATAELEHHLPFGFHGTFTRRLPA